MSVKKEINKQIPLTRQILKPVKHFTDNTIFAFKYFSVN